MSVVLVVTFNLCVSGQQIVGKETLAIDYFNAGNFEKALPIFAKLAQGYPDNAMYNYYYGVSLIKNNIFETSAKEALLNAVVDKTPVNSNFYLAIYFHAREEWQEADEFYSRYKKVGKTPEKKSLRYDYYVDLCTRKINPFKPAKLSDNKMFGDSTLKPPPKVDEKTFPMPEALLKAWFNFSVNEVLVYHSINDFKSEAGKILFAKAWICTGMNDSIIAATDSMRREHDRVNRVESRLGLVAQIVDCEQKSYQLMRDREKFLEQSRVKESGYWEKEGQKAASEYNAIIQERENKVNESKKKAEPKVAEILVSLVKPDSIAQPKDIPAIPSPVVQKSVAVSNLVYKVQIGSFKNGILTPVFKKTLAKMTKLRKIDTFKDPRKYVIYSVGNFSQYNDATRLKEQLILEGMKGSFVVAYHNGNKITVQEALKLAGGK